MNEGFSLVGFLDSWLGGAATTLIGAAMGRLMYHSLETKKGKRRFFGKELIWEIPICIGMALIGDSVAVYLELSRPVSVGVIAALAYLGPRGAEVILMNWLSRKAK
ncbi:phage holin family protein [Hoeflea sp. TYP-13]|uniref:phage holin family protein n=1 Tax=Hoeflea sp. TYP-13 TaxID=3230023 RepID=UPI0034C5D505